MTDRTLRFSASLLLAVVGVGSVAHGQTSVVDRVTSLERRVATVERVAGVAPDPTAIEGGPAPLAVHLDAADAIDVERLGETRVSWDFGDAGGERNAMDGFNASHAYDRPGRYTITRTVDVAGVGATTGPTHGVRTYVVDVAADARRAIHVSADGDDRNDGATPERPVRTWAAAVAMTRGNTDVLLRRGDTFDLDRPAEVRADDVRIASYGEASLPAPTLRTPLPVAASFAILAVRGRRCVIEDVTFDAAGFTTYDKTGVPDAIIAGGKGLLVRRCTFRNVVSAINGNARPDGVLMIDCDAPLDTGMRAYFTWVQGTNWCILDNRAANSTREHIVRVGGAERINVQGNRFANLDRRPLKENADPSDFNKSCLNVQIGRVLYVAHNVFVDGPVSVGPLGGADGLRDTSPRWVGAVIEDNRCDEAQVQVQHGASHVTLRNLLVRKEDDVAIAIAGWNAQYQRGVDDVTIEQCTAVDAGARGQFVHFAPGSTRLRLIGNYFAAPNLLAGAYDTSAVFVAADDLGAFTEIRGNRWPAMRGKPAANGGVNYIAPQGGTAAGYVDAARWAAMTPVSGDAAVAVDSIDVLRRDDAGVDVDRLPPEAPAGGQEKR